MLSDLTLPNGLKTLGIPVLGGLGMIPVTSGKYFFVDSVNGSDGNNGLSPDRAYATIQYAVNQCVDSRGDCIVVLPGHSETLSSAGALALNKIGISIVGVGNGSLRPKLTLDTAATADVAVSADDITVRNINFEANFADVATCFELTTATDFRVEYCEFTEAGTDLNWVKIFRTDTNDNSADGLAIVGCRFISADTAFENVVQVQGDCDSMVFKDNFFNLAVNDGDAVIEVATGKDLTNVYVGHNKGSRLNTTGDLLIDNDTTANTGTVEYNHMLHADTVGEILVDCDGVGLFENRATAVVTASGYLLPAADS